MAKEFIKSATATTQMVVTPKGNKYRFFRKQPYIVKDKDDIKWFEENPAFISKKEVEKQEVKEEKKSKKEVEKQEVKEKKKSKKILKRG